MTYKAADAAQKYLLDLVDQNVATDAVPANVASEWKTARAATKKLKDTFGAKEEGTQALEKLALRGQELDNTTLIREGLNSPDKLTAHIQA
ncbi:hypothetical protein, partial [Streptococcus pneumoniae]|uniref:hypothetical protein n=1 Tax=Streptococcus pneumoniae TaxID=1313 RepID=UPI0012D7B1B9